MLTPVETCARALLEATPQLMQLLREEMRAGRTPDLSVPQFRTLAWLSRNPGGGLGEAAEGIGLSAPSMSRLMDGLVRDGLAAREQDRTDRRRVRLALTPAGRVILGNCREAAAQAFARRLASLSPGDLDQVAEALRTLRALFIPHAPGYAPKGSGRPAAR